MKLLTPILSLFYGFGVKIRNSWYDNPKHTFPVSVKTIGVGNLSVGGTGKTPHVMMLVELLQKEGVRVAVLSRGYKRQSKGFVLADGNSRYEDLGDELMQLHVHYPELIVAACEDRVLGVEELLKHHPDLECVLLDDAFQHRRLRCGMQLLLTPFDQPYYEDHLLPWGRLREPAVSSHRADAIIVTRTTRHLLPAEKVTIGKKLGQTFRQKLFFTSVENLPLEPLFDSFNVIGVNDWSQNVVLLTGIANGGAMMHHIRNRYQRITHLKYADHKHFTEEDMLKLQQTVERTQATVVITTEKDAARLRELGCYPEELKPITVYLPIRVTMEDTESFNQYILNYVRKNP